VLFASLLLDYEVIVPLAIFGLFAAMAWWALDRVAVGKPRTIERLDELKYPRKRNPADTALKKTDAVTKMLERATPALAKPLPCRAFETPVTGGNVSFYNESPTGAIDPTPTIGMVGVLERVADRVPSHFSEPGDRILVLGTTAGVLGGSAYWAELAGFVGGEPARLDLDAERRLQRLLEEAAREQLLRSAHDCSEGGLAVALAEAAIGGPYARHAFGAAVDLTGYADGLDPAALLFGEDGARVVVSASSAAAGALAELCGRHGVPVFAAGAVESAGGALTVKVGGRLLTWDTRHLRRTWFDAIPRRMRHADLDRTGA
jgi:phosphoribosylformylglycinamidine synthase